MSYAHPRIPGLRPLLPALALGLLASPSCNQPTSPGGATSAPASSSAPVASSGDILVGEFGSLTGSEATFGQSTHNGIMLAVNEFNAKGGFNGRKIAVKTYDDQGKSQEAGTAVSRLITDDHVVAVIGEVASSLSLAGGRVAQQYGVPMISPSSTNARVTKEIGDMVSRVCFVDSFQGYVMAKFAWDDLKAKKVAILYDQGQAYSKGLKDDFKKAYIAMGGTVPTEQAYTGGDQDFSAQLTTIRGTSPEAIYLPGYYTDVGNVALQARKLGINVPFLGGDGWDSAKLAEIGGKAIEGSYYSNHYSFQEKRPEVQGFVARFQKAYGQTPDGLAALGYDAANLLFDAMARAKSLSGKELAAAINSTRDFHAVTGVISLDADRNPIKQAVVVQMKDGKPTYVTTIEPPKTAG